MAESCPPKLGIEGTTEIVYNSLSKVTLHEIMNKTNSGIDGTTEIVYNSLSKVTLHEITKTNSL